MMEALLYYSTGAIADTSLLVQIAQNNDGNTRFQVQAMRRKATWLQGE